MPRAKCAMCKLNSTRRASYARAGALALCLALGAACAHAQDRYPGIGRAAMPSEIAAWDIDVRADFKGLPKGSGSVARGQDIWDRQCASCHGTFGESNEVFPPLIGGTTVEDAKRGHVRSLVASTEQRTTMMKLARLSTLWDYIRRAMPWTAPKSLSVDDVYSVTAYMLNMADLVPGDFVLSEQNMQDVQGRLPNRNGLRPHAGLSNLRGRPDVRNTACMKDCAQGEPGITSSYPDSAKDTHGNLAEQNRLVGPVRGVVTMATSGQPATNAAANAGGGLVRKHGCQACHGIGSRIVGPAFREIGQRYAGVVGAESGLMGKIRAGGSGAWGAIPMPAQPSIADDEIRAMVQWVLGGAL